ncbi:hypothetical protein Mp_4g19170 [Marchantia polymorpha subsp. ruderalis]|uniref:Uncharacterized protein n=2 Tax=Marchantia polymorpha TaxID=3197 RepID=A0AAF6BBH8_MARPO|nr:hypothetical protein MARPO_0169s0027 [Marchantia polymorpha]BBN09362.1 hypothetical protein Mp_4g19170 [Marchantia polymorpha subsp. ruderalis]|eukprot:PTQ28267.1 hypothetical protein MARPO_0169s0027 [Marchantia polymorpha]
MLSRRRFISPRRAGGRAGGRGVGPSSGDLCRMESVRARKAFSAEMRRYAPEDLPGAARGKCVESFRYICDGCGWLIFAANTEEIYGPPTRGREGGREGGRPDQ